MTSPVIWRANDFVRDPLDRLLGEGEAQFCQKTDVSALPSTQSSATARTRASAGSGQRGGRGLLHQTLDSVSMACNFHERNDQPNSFRPNLNGRGRNIWFLSSFPFYIKQEENEIKTVRIKCFCSCVSSIPVGNGTKNPLHHGQMFAIVVRLKQGHTQVEFKEDATNRPDIARLRPAQFYTSAGNISPIKSIVNYLRIPR